MLDLDAPVRVHTNPYDWALADGVVPGPVLDRLRGALPSLGRFDRKERPGGGDKSYRMYVLPLVQAGVECEALRELDPVWAGLVRHLRTPEYLDWVDQCTGARVADCRSEIGLFVFGPGDFVSAHTDKDGKLASHVLYLNDGWDEQDGGAFEVLTGDSEDPPHALLTPAAPSSVVFARSERSWHAVAPIRDQAPRLRVTIQVEMWA